MHLTRFQLANFRGIRDLDLAIEELEVIFGRNNTGKSTVLEAISEYANLVRRNVGDDWYTDNVRNRDDSLFIEFIATFELSTAEVDRIAHTLREKGYLNTPQGVRSFTAAFDGELRTTYRHGQRGVVTAELEASIDGTWEIVTRLYRSPDSRNEMRERDLTTLGEMSWKGRMKGDVESLSHCLRPVSNLFRETTDDWREVSAFRQPDNRDDVGEKYELRKDASNLPAVLHTLDNNRRSAFRRIVEAYATMMEGVTDVQTRISGSGTHVKTTPYIIEDQVEYSLSEISSGSKELLALLTEIETADENTDLLMLEEPEIHLHPGAQRTLFEYIQAATERADVQIVLTTHSEVFINNAPPEALSKSVRTQGGSEFTSIDPEEVTEELANIGYDKSGLLQSKGVVFTEGRSDVRILEEFADTVGYSPAEHGTEFVDLEGEGNMNAHGQSLVKLLDAFGIPYLFVQDSHDGTAREAENELLQTVNSGGGSWEVTPNEIFVWDAYEIEAYLLDPPAIAAFLSVDEEEVETAIDSSDAETPSGVLDDVFESVAAKPFNKVEHGPFIARHIAADRVPEKVTNAIEKIESL